MFCGRRDFTWVSISMEEEGDDDDDDDEWIYISGWTFPLIPYS